MEKIGTHLKTQRETLGLSQSALSKATGLAQTTISAYENDTNVPNIYACITLADFYGISLDELVGRD